ncbi:MAG: 1-acyl-sn-glycerol-3-phosphate acyltransferase, partial [Bacteroidota bacterium]
MEKNKIYPHVYERMEDWPIHKLHQDRKAFVQEITDFTVERLKKGKTEDITEMIGKTAYLEQIRIKEEPWKIDPPNDRSFWKKIQKRLVKKVLDEDEAKAKAANQEILTSIVNRYAEEIVATFKIKTFLFARKFLTFFFSRLLNTAANRNFRRFFNSRRHQLGERMKISGEIEKVRALMKKGTVIVLPTHHSNLDSVLIGYIMDTFGGLPHFSFAAGLNLYNTGYTAYFINRVGAYRLDRRKKNPIYLETLKAMSNLAIQRGTNCIIFPGGTRSRSGHLEKKLKMGMMGTIVEAQQALAAKGKAEKIFVVPVVVGYHFVLEAPFLIEQHLRQTGKDRYINVKDSSYSFRKILRFAWKYFSNGSEILLTFGQPLDVLGNFVNEAGDSFDQYGNKI